MEAGGDVEDRTVRVGVPTSWQVDPLVDLVANEHRAHENRNDDPRAGLLALTVFS